MQPVEVRDASGFTGAAERWLTPADEREVVEILAAARESQTPVTVVGARKGLVGGAVPPRGWALSLERFRRLDIQTGFAWAGAGLPLSEAQAAALRTGQFYPPDPTEKTASVGGTIATNASGSRSFLYGATRANVRALRVATMDGRVWTTRRGEAVPFPVTDLVLPRTTKLAAGYPLKSGMDWVDLLVGSEGTLGVVLEAELRLLPSPASIVAGVYFFASLEATLDAVDAWRGTPGLRMLEFVDEPSLRLMSGRYPDIPAEALGALMVEEAGNAEAAGLAWQERARSAGALPGSWFAATVAERELFRVFRHALPEAVNELVYRNGVMKLGTDCAVPLEQNRAMLAHYREVLTREFPGQHFLYGHIGDAHVHVNVLARNQVEFARGQQVITGFAEEAIRRGGTFAAEHGVGKRKAHLLALQFGAEGVAAMRDVKRRLDPEGLLGVGNLFGVG